MLAPDKEKFPGPQEYEHGLKDPFTPENDPASHNKQAEAPF
jgi:hypothetical protein